MSFKVIKPVMIAMLAWCCIPGRAQTMYTLQQALQTAKSNNPILKREQYNVSISQADITTAQLRPNPILNNQSLQLVQPSRFSENSSWYNGANRQVWWQVTKPFQLPVQRQNKINFAEQNVRLTQKQYADTERHLFQTVAQKWLDVWTARKQLDLLGTAKSNIDSLANINRLRLKNQVITTTDLSRTELLANQYDIQLKTARQNYQNEIINLKFLMGTADSVQVDTADQFAFAFPSQMDAIVQEALQSRTDIQAIKSTMDVADANIKLQKSNALPTPELGLIFNPQNKVNYMGVYGTIEIPVFSRNQGEIRKSEIVKQQAEQDLRATETQIQTEILTAYKSYQTQKQNVQNFNQLLTQSQTILNSVKYSYLRGGTTIIDFLEAQRSWLDTQQQYYDLLQQYRQSYIDLLNASGMINQIAQ
ncbi:TolC family protein [Dyadobacter pollutisoli]|uniref:TolC family protein n=1 Tax=Dyadobacter pollutisoli TaxID=2910158 RepID=A0A9E8SRL4_9BACT|nr:TolC family protein [Dyadobacter pollutisoli]WAC14312.1 TolC family protein [Dyadobacter pollutisoli]